MSNIGFKIFLDMSLTISNRENPTLPCIFLTDNTSRNTTPQYDNFRQVEELHQSMTNKCKKQNKFLAKAIASIPMPFIDKMSQTGSLHVEKMQNNKNIYISYEYYKNYYTKVAGTVQTLYMKEK